jgi:hypothetical protein
MKNLKVFMLAGALAVSASAFAQDYNMVGLSYNNTSYGFNDAYGRGHKDLNYSTNGIGIDYIHGFSVSKSLPMFVELGGNINFNFHSETEEEDGYKATAKFQNINLQVPVNFAWRFNIIDDFSIKPYVGINFKLNLVSQNKAEYENPDGEKEDSKWISCFDKGEEAMDGSEYTWNRFQMGWQIGVGFQYKPFYLGVQYGTDFIHAYSHKFEEDGEKWTPRISNGNLKLVLAYSF